MHPRDVRLNGPSETEDATQLSSSPIENEGVTIRLLLAVSTNHKGLGRQQWRCCILCRKGVYLIRSKDSSREYEHLVFRLSLSPSRVPYEDPARASAYRGGYEAWPNGTFEPRWQFDQVSAWLEGWDDARKDQSRGHSGESGELKAAEWEGKIFLRACGEDVIFAGRLMRQRPGEGEG